MTVLGLFWYFNHIICPIKNGFDYKGTCNGAFHKLSNNYLAKCLLMFA